KKNGKRKRVGKERVVVPVPQSTRVLRSRSAVAASDYNEVDEDMLKAKMKKMKKDIDTAIEEHPELLEKSINQVSVGDYSDALENSVHDVDNSAEEDVLMQELMEAQRKFQEKKAEAELMIRKKKEAAAQRLNIAAELERRKEDELLLRMEDELEMDKPKTTASSPPQAGISPTRSARVATTAVSNGIDKSSAESVRLLNQVQFMVWMKHPFWHPVQDELQRTTPLCTGKPRRRE
ncbi:hypothetical protein ZWY2020_058102, partial [Hordeum vulgare]